MKKFSLVSESIKKRFISTATINLSIEAENSGEAGYISDSILGSISNLEDFFINNIKEVNSNDSEESDLSFFISKSIENLKDVESGLSSTDCPSDFVVAVGQVIYMLNNAKNKIKNGI